MSNPVGQISPPLDRTLRPGTVVALDPRAVSWSDDSILIGGSPWRISRLGPPTKALVARLRRKGGHGVSAATIRDLSVFRELIDRGFAVALPHPDSTTRECEVVIPVLDRVGSFRRCLASVRSQRVTVVDDGSSDADAISAIAAEHGAALTRHQANRGPAAARNTGLRATAADFIAFLDSDCKAPPGWPQSMLHHFDDPTIAAVAPRIVPANPSRRLIERYEATRSSLDFGPYPEIARPGGRLAFVSTAAFILRRTALAGSGFDEDLRLGEDVDLVWRLDEAGWLVRYDPSVLVSHETRTNPREWLTRRYEYGTSAAGLDARHPGNLTPARPSPWNLASLGLVATGHTATAAAITAAATVALARRLKAMPQGTLLAASIVPQGIVADAAAIGHLLRREWWPVGAIALTCAPRSRAARLATLCMLAPIGWEWATERPKVDPIRYTALRLVEDAAYGTGVISSSLRAKIYSPLLPRIKFPRFGGKRSDGAHRRLLLTWARDQSQRSWTAPR